MPALNLPTKLGIRRSQTAATGRLLISVWAASLVIFAFLISTAFAGDEVISNYNFAVTIPDGWVVMTNMLSQKDVRAAYTEPNKKRMLLFLVDPGHSPFMRLNASFITGYERGALRSGGTKPITANTIDAAGTKAYERYTEKPSNGKTISNLTRVMVSDGNVYIIECLKFNGNASEDEVLRGALDSFHFINPPSEKALAYRMGYMMGFGFAFLAFIGGILAIIFFIRRKATPRPPPLPPRR